MQLCIGTIFRDSESSQFAFFFFFFLNCYIVRPQLANSLACQGGP